MRSHLQTVLCCVSLVGFACNCAPGGGSQSKGNSKEGDSDEETQDTQDTKDTQDAQDSSDADKESGTADDKGDASKKDKKKKGRSSAIILKHGWDIPTIANLRRFIDELNESPFDGVILSGRKASRIFGPKEYDQETFERELKALDKVSFTGTDHNFLIQYVDTIKGGWNGPGVDILVRNAERMAKAASGRGLKGIAFDNEVYSGDPWTTPKACPGLDRKACGEAAHRAGKRMMQAIIKHWPDVEFMAFFGPWLNDSRTYRWVQKYAPQNAFGDKRDVSGEFLAGVFEATLDTPAVFIDGGEFYGLRERSHFRKTAEWMRSEMIKKSPFFPDKLREKYAKQMKVGFGLYDDRQHLYREHPRVDPGIWSSMIKNAAKEADYVWLYTERHDWWATDGNNWPDKSKPGAEGPVSPAWKSMTKKAIESMR